jgi:hypothetical protein
MQRVKVDVVGDVAEEGEDGNERTAARLRLVEQATT